MENIQKLTESSGDQENKRSIMHLVLNQLVKGGDFDKALNLLKKYIQRSAITSNDVISKFELYSELVENGDRSPELGKSITKLIDLFYKEFKTFGIDENDIDMTRSDEENNLDNLEFGG